MSILVCDDYISESIGDGFLVKESMQVGVHITPDGIDLSGSM